jgi:hypothetical protein
MMRADARADARSARNVAMDRWRAGDPLQRFFFPSFKSWERGPSDPLSPATPAKRA